MVGRHGGPPPEKQPFNLSEADPLSDGDVGGAPAVGVHRADVLDEPAMILPAQPDDLRCGLSLSA